MKRPAKHKVQKNAKERISTLFSLAKQHALNGAQALADRYVFLARKLSMKARIPLGEQYKGQYCRHCTAFLIPSKNCRVRLSRGKVVYWCFSCKRYTKFVYK
jgi:ribonuclease P protein subunit RPR2